LTTINVQAGVAAHLLDRDPDNVRGALATIEQASHDALDELRAILGVLREPGIGNAPLEPAPGLAAIDVLIEQARGNGLQVTFATEGEQPPSIPDAVQLAAFRIVQESLTNVRRHALGAAARVNVGYRDDRLHVLVENDSGQIRNGDGSTTGVGIPGMRERAVALGGTLFAGRADGCFRVEPELPYRRGSA
jgi:signal transduction histidine kinase